MKVVIRDLEIKDAKIAWKWRNDPTVWQFTDRGVRNPVTMEIERDWIENVTQRKNEKRFAICVGDSQKYIGNVQLTEINSETALFHIFIGEKNYWGKGIATKATNLLLDYIATNLDIKKINLKVRKDNIAAVKVYEKIGFVTENEKDHWYLMSYKMPMVSIAMITHNHEQYIKVAIESILIQKVDFPIELVIGEDCSTDNTRNICLEYKKKYPHIIRLLLPEKNIGALQNSINTFRACRGKYIAICEGDDYWTYLYKLQKQVDFLEKNKDVVLCFHKVNVLFEEGINNSDIYSHLEERAYSSFEVYEKWTIPTCSVLFRNTMDRITWPKVNIIHGDIYLYLSLMEFGCAYCLDFIGAVYRRNVGGTSTKTDVETNRKLFEQYRFMQKKFPPLKSISIRKKNNYLEQLIYAPFFKGIWKYRFYKMLQEPKLIFSTFFTTTLTSYIINRKRNK